MKVNPNVPDWLLEILQCPETREPLELQTDFFVRKDGWKYPIVERIPVLVFPFQLTDEDEKWNKFYDLLAPFYDWQEKFFGKLLTGLDIEEERKKIISYLKLKEGMKVLEVSPGPGIFQEYIRKQIHETGKLVALDLSFNMLKQCEKKQSKLDTVLIQGNASYLPFKDESFDALFHFGGVNLFNEPLKALEEFVRVVKRGGIVAWGDEGFSKNLPDTWQKRILAKINPGYLKDRLPIPKGLIDIQEYDVYGGYAYLIVGIKS